MAQKVPVELFVDASEASLVKLATIAAVKGAKVPVSCAMQQEEFSKPGRRFIRLDCLENSKEWSSTKSKLLPYRAKRDMCIDHDAGQ